MNNEETQDFTQWPPSELLSQPITFGWSLNESRDEQPGVGITVNWNKPKQRAKPFVVIQVGYWGLNIGWLFT